MNIANYKPYNIEKRIVYKMQRTYNGSYSLLGSNEVKLITCEFSTAAMNTVSIILSSKRKNCLLIRCCKSN